MANVNGVFVGFCEGFAVVGLDIVGLNVGFNGVGAAIVGLDDVGFDVGLSVARHDPPSATPKSVGM